MNYRQSSVLVGSTSLPHTLTCSTEELQRQSTQIIKRVQKQQDENFKKFKILRKKIPYQSTNNFYNQDFIEYPLPLQHKPSYSHKPSHNRSRNQSSENLRKNDSNRSSIYHSHYQQNNKNYNSSKILGNVWSYLEIKLSETQGLNFKALSMIMKKLLILYQKINHVQSQTDNLREIYSYVKQNRMKNSKRSSITDRIYEENNRQLAADNQNLCQENQQLKAKVELLLAHNSEKTENQDNVQRLQFQLAEKQEECKIEKKKRQQQQALIETNIKQFRDIYNTKINEFQNQKRQLIDKIQILQQELNGSKDLYPNLPKLDNEQQSINQQLQFEITSLKHQINTKEEELSVKNEQCAKLVMKIDQLESKQRILTGEIEEQALSIKKNEENSLKKQIVALQKIKKLQSSLNNQRQQLQTSQLLHEKNLATIEGQLRSLVRNSSKRNRISSKILQGNQLENTFSIILAQIKNIQKQIELGKNFEQEIKEILEKNFNVSSIEYEMKGVKDIIENIGLEMQDKNKKILMQEQQNFSLEKQLKKTQITVKNTEKQQKMADKKLLSNSLSQSLIRNHRSRQKLEESQFQREVVHKNQIITKLRHELDIKQNQLETLKKDSLIEFQTLKSQINLLTKTNQDLMQQHKNLNYEAEGYIKQISNLKAANKEVKQDIENTKKQISRKDAQNRKQQIQWNSKLRKSENQAKKFKKQNQLLKQEHMKSQQNYQNLINQKKRVIDELYSKNTKTNAEIKILNEKINNQKLFESDNSPKKKKKFYIVRPQPMRYTYKTENIHNVKELQDKLDKTEESNIELELQKRKLSREIAELQKVNNNGDDSSKIIDKNIIKLQQSLINQKKIKQDVEARLRILQKEKQNFQIKLYDKQIQITHLRDKNNQLQQKSQKFDLTMKEHEIKEKQLLKIIETTKDGTQKDILKLKRQYNRNIEQKQQELREFIEKYNDARVELIDELDGKSDKMHEIQIENEKHISLLKEQVQLLESQLQQKDDYISIILNKLEREQPIRKSQTAVQRNIHQQQPQHDDNQSLSENQYPNIDQNDLKSADIKPKKYSIQYSDSNDDQEQLADEVEQLDFYSPLQKRIIVEGDDQEQEHNGKFSLGLNDMLGNYDDHDEEVMEAQQF